VEGQVHILRLPGWPAFFVRLAHIGGQLGGHERDLPDDAPSRASDDQGDRWVYWFVEQGGHPTGGGDFAVPRLLGLADVCAGEQLRPADTIRFDGHRAVVGHPPQLGAVGNQGSDWRKGGLQGEHWGRARGGGSCGCAEVGGPLRYRRGVYHSGRRRNRRAAGAGSDDERQESGHCEGLHKGSVGEEGGGKGSVEDEPCR
jgi:hypothetical protein